MNFESLGIRVDTGGVDMSVSIASLGPPIWSASADQYSLFLRDLARSFRITSSAVSQSSSIARSTSRPGMDVAQFGAVLIERDARLKSEIAENIKRGRWDGILA